jgi:G:T/U-mismatch repair DNA glycosylase
MRIKNMSNEQLVKAYGVGSAKEATWLPSNSGRGRKSFEKLCKRNAALEKELLRRLNERG